MDVERVIFNKKFVKCNMTVLVKYFQGSLMYEIIVLFFVRLWNGVSMKLRFISNLFSLAIVEDNSVLEWFFNIWDL